MYHCDKRHCKTLLIWSHFGKQAPWPNGHELGFSARPIESQILRARCPPGENAVSLPASTVFPLVFTGNYAVVDIPPTGSLQRPKPSQATITDLRGRRTAGLAVEDPHLKYYSDSEGYSSKPKNTADPPASSYMMRGQNGRSPGAFGLRRPLSGSSNASTASGISASSGERLANYRGSSNMATRQGVMKASSGSQTGADTSPEAYGPSTMERKKRAMQAKMSVQNGYQSADEGRSSTLGRKQRGDIKERLFGSKGNLNRPTTGPDGQLINSTIISNPHATYSKDRSNSLSKGSISPSSANYVNINYLSADYLNGRPVSATSPISGSPWLKSTPTSVANGAWPALSETESIESISSSASSSIQAQIQQARAHAYASKTILAQEKEGLVPQSIHRSDSFKSTQSERIYATPAQLEAEIHRTGSFSQMNGPSSPTGSQSSHASSRYCGMCCAQNSVTPSVLDRKCGYFPVFCKKFADKNGARAI